jgi:regulatory protein
MGQDRALREAAYRLLARREHSRHQLRRKLKDRDWCHEEVEELLDRLEEEGLQSDLRFAQAFARSRVERGYGPVRIRSELGQRGVDRGLAAQVVDGLEVDWIELAGSQYRRRYGDTDVDSRKERARRWNAMRRRGFTGEQIRPLLG